MYNAESRVGVLLEHKKIPFNPSLITGIESEVSIAIENILEMPEGLLNRQVAKGNELRDRIKLGDNDLIAEAIASHAAWHIGTMTIFSELVHDESIEKTPEEKETIFTALDFHLLASINGIKAVIKFQKNNDPSGLLNYLAGMIIHVNEELNSGNLDKYAEEEAKQELAQYEILQANII